MQFLFIVLAIIFFIIATYFFIENEKNKSELRSLHSKNLDLEEYKANSIPKILFEEKEKQLDELKENYKNELIDIVHSQKSNYVSKDQVNLVENLLKELPNIVKSQIQSDVTGDTSALAQTTKNMMKNIDELKNSITENTSKSEEWLKPIYSFAENFNNVLYNNRKRGRLGEITLANILESAGLKKGISFFEQVKNDQDGSIVDFKINLPDGQNIVIDSKFPLENWNEFLAANENNKKAKLESFVKDIKNHIRKLQKSEYHKSHHSALNKTTMFLSNDEALISAYEFDAGLKIFADQNNVILLSPSSLIPFLELAHVIILADKRDEEIDKMIEIVQNIYDESIKVHQEMHGIKNTVTKLVSELNSLRSIYNGEFYSNLEQLHELDTLKSSRAKKHLQNSKQITNLNLKPIGKTRKPENWENQF